MSIFSDGKITQVKGISDKRRLPRLGKIRLGFKLKKGDVEYPAESPFFVLPLEVARVYGFKDEEEDVVNPQTQKRERVIIKAAKERALDRAKNYFHVTRGDVLRFIEQNHHRLAEEIEIMLPVNDIGAVFPQALKMYGSSKGVKCMGNGEQATTYDEKQDMIKIECPCGKLKADDNPKGECTLRGHLLCLVPKVSVAGIWQVDSSSYNSIVDVNSGISYVEALIGRFAMVPLVLRRIPTETHYDNKRQIHYTLQLILDPSINIETLNALRLNTERILKHAHYALPPADDINPAMDKETEVIYDAEFEDAPEGLKSQSVTSSTSEGQKPPESEKSDTQGVVDDKQIRLDIIDSIKQLRKKLPKDKFEPIRNKYKANITDCTLEELQAFEKEVKQAITGDYAKTAEELFKENKA